jgi:hypothetical protein
MHFLLSSSFYYSPAHKIITDILPSFYMLM